ncbi:MAG: hypothetical protein ABSF43_13350 [Rectinemataceae bacterium]|jgi:hypothetical protein
MKITVDFPDSEIDEIMLFSGEKKKGPAIRKLVQDALLLKRRGQYVEKFISGEWGVELAGFEEEQKQDRTAEKRHEQDWRL